MDKISSAFSLAKKAGKLLVGFDAVVHGMQQKEVCLAAVSSDLSPKTKKEVLYFAQKEGICCIDLPRDMEQLCAVFNRRVGVLAVTDEHFAQLVRRSVFNHTVL